MIFFPQLPQAMITSHDFKTSLIFTKSTLITSVPQTTWRPTVLVVWLASFVLLRISLLMWPRPSEVFWWMYIHPKLPGLLPMNSSQGVTPPAYTFSLHVELFFSHQVVSNSFVTLWTIARQALLSMGFPRQEYWSSLPEYLAFSVKFH